MEPSSRTGRYWIVWEERRGRWRLRAISRAAAATTVLLALLAASAGILLALTQAEEPWVGWGWAAWVLAVALTGGRVLAALALGPVRRSTPLRGGGRMAPATLGGDRGIPDRSHGDRGWTGKRRDENVGPVSSKHRR